MDVDGPETLLWTFFVSQVLKLEGPSKRSRTYACRRDECGCVLLFGFSEHERTWIN